MSNEDSEEKQSSRAERDDAAADGSGRPAEHDLIDLASGVAMCCDIALETTGNRNAARRVLKMMRAAANSRLEERPDWARQDVPGLVVLVVDDNPLMLVSMEQILREGGHLAFGAQSREAALRVFELVGGQVDVLVSDVELAGADGRALAAELQACRPDLHVVYATASRDATADATVLRKPLDGSRLLAAIAEVSS